MAIASISVSVSASVPALVVYALPGGAVPCPSRSGLSCALAPIGSREGHCFLDGSFFDSEGNRKRICATAAIAHSMLLMSNWAVSSPSPARRARMRNANDAADATEGRRAEGGLNRQRHANVMDAPTLRATPSAAIIFINGHVKGIVDAMSIEKTAKDKVTRRMVVMPMVASQSAFASRTAWLAVRSSAPEGALALVSFASAVPAGAPPAAAGGSPVPVVSPVFLPVPAPSPSSTPAPVFPLSICLLMDITPSRLVWS